MLRRSTRPLGSYLLRIAEVRTERFDLVYDLVELHDGSVLRFGSLAALRRHLQARSGAQAPARPRRK
jgi:hypothetical protein